MKNLCAVAGLVALVLVGSGCKKKAGREATSKPAEKTAGPAPAANAEKNAPAAVTMSPEAIRAAGVMTAPVAESKLTVYDEMPGSIEAPSDALVVVNTPASGVVEALAVDVGDPVTRGKRLATVRSPELAKAQADYRRSVVAEQHAASALERSEALEREGLISRRRVEADRLQWRASQLGIEEASQHIRILGGSLKDATGSVGIVSPIAGTITTRTANRGEAVAQNAPLFTVVDVSRVVVQLRAPGGVRVEPGTQVTFTADVLPGRIFAATVKSASDVLDPETRRFFIRCTLVNKDNLLKPGMFVTGKVPRPTVTAIVVPETAVMDMEGGKSVFVAHEGGQFERRVVVLGPRAEGQVAVQSGLKEHEAVVTKGAFWVRTQLQKSELEE
ncbi:MAG: efflux RND transporter periplasmic adaptor subunit [Myxococcales bacterium]